MVHLIAIPVTLLVGALATSYAEYKFKYNLVDKILDIFGYAKKDVATAIVDVKKI